MAKKRISRDEAQDRSLARYYTGKACRNGHKVERYTVSQNCVQCTMDANVRKVATINPTYAKIKKREKNLKDRYGITLQDYMRMVDQQNGRCACCHNLATDMMVDHCHTKNQVRGLLCSTCNSIIGFGNDNTMILQLAIEYLVKHS